MQLLHKGKITQVGLAELLRTFRDVADDDDDDECPGLADEIMYPPKLSSLSVAILAQGSIFF